MDAVDSFSDSLLSLVPALGGLLTALVAGAVGLVLITLVVARPVRPVDPGSWYVSGIGARVRLVLTWANDRIR